LEDVLDFGDDVCFPLGLNSTSSYGKGLPIGKLVEITRPTIGFIVDAFVVSWGDKWALWFGGIYLEYVV
jgi:hypothetical protein